MNDRFEVEGKWSITIGEYLTLVSALKARGHICARTLEQADHFLPVDRTTDNRRLRFETTDGKTTIFYTLKRECIVNGVKVSQKDERKITEDKAGRILKKTETLTGQPAPLLYKVRREYDFAILGKPARVRLDIVDNKLFFLEVQAVVTKTDAVRTIDDQIESLALSFFAVEHIREFRSQRVLLCERLTQKKPVKP